MSVIIFIAPFLGIIAVAPLFLQKSVLIHQSSPVLLILISFLLAITVGIGFLSSTLMAILCSYFYNATGGVIALLIYMTSCAIGYYIAYVNANFFTKILYKKKGIKDLIQVIKDDKYTLIPLLRLSPILPFAWCNYLLGVLKFDFKSYMVGSMIGMIPRMALSIWIGMELSNLAEISNLSGVSYYQYSILFLITFSFVGLAWWGKQKYNLVINGY